MPATQTSEHPQVLVLGAYGLAGRAIVHRLLAHTSYRVLATGRNAEKLQTLSAELDDPRYSSQVLNAGDLDAVASACERCGFVINAVGPYLVHGAAIARAVIETGTPYLDFANEQLHYRRLEKLDQLAQERGVLLCTGAGAIPGMSTLLAMHAAAQLPDCEELDLYWAQRRMPYEGGGLASLMSGVLEAGHRPLRLRKGEWTPTGLGDEWRSIELPPPFGATQFVGVATIDTLVLPHQLSVRDLQDWFAMGKIPPGLPLLVRLLRPHQWQWSYKLFQRIADRLNRMEYREAMEAEHGPEGLLMARAQGGGKTWEGHVTFRDGGVATAVLPVLIADLCLSGQRKQAGLHTPIDLVDFTQALTAANDTITDKNLK